MYHNVHDTDSVSYFTFEYLLNTVVFDMLFCKHFPVTPQIERQNSLFYMNSNHQIVLKYSLKLKALYSIQLGIIILMCIAIYIYIYMQISTIHFQEPHQPKT